MPNQPNKQNRKATIAASMAKQRANADEIACLVAFDKAMTAASKARQRVESTTEIPDERMRNCPRCGSPLGDVCLMQLSGTVADSDSPFGHRPDSETIWAASCESCHVFVECRKPPPDGPPTWTVMDQKPEWLRQLDEIISANE